MGTCYTSPWVGCVFFDFSSERLFRGTGSEMEALSPHRVWGENMCESVINGLSFTFCRHNR